MDTLQLEYFLEVARMGNMTSAAATLNTSQSSVSRSIARLEETLGVPLFERHGRGMELNNYGKTYYAYAESVLRELNEGERRLKDIRDSHFGRVSFSSCSPRAINTLVMEFLVEYPDVLFRQRRLMDMNIVKTYLDNGLIDYALTYAPLPDSEYEWTPLVTEHFYLMVNPAHRLADQDKIYLSQLEGERLLVNAYNDPDYIDSQCRLANIVPRYGFISEEHELLGQMVENDLGLSFISTLGLYEMKSTLPLSRLSRTRIIPVADNGMRRTIGILRRKHHYMSSAAHAFYKKLCAYLKNIELNMLDYQ